MAKMKSLIIASIAIAASAVNAAETFTVIGSLQIRNQGGVRASVYSGGEIKAIVLYVYDKHGIGTVQHVITSDQARAIRTILDDAITEAEKNDQHK